jgi:hypothetical protein
MLKSSPVLIGHSSSCALPRTELFRSLLVQIDARQTKIKPQGWQIEFDRPIYFVDLRDTYVCSWREIDGYQLVLIPLSTIEETIKTRPLPWGCRCHWTVQGRHHASRGDEVSA